MKHTISLSFVCLLFSACSTTDPLPVSNSSVPSTPVPANTAQSTIPSISTKPTPTTEALLSWHIPVLMYHHVGDVPANADAIRKGLTVSSQTFEKHLELIKAHHYNPVTFDTVQKYIEQGVPLPPKPVIITLDDGYDDNFTNAFPALEKNALPAVFYIITDKVGTGGYMTWKQIDQLKKHGQEIGAHTRTHPDLAVISGNAQKLKDEVVQAKQILDDHQLGPILSMAYPSGKYNAAVAALAGRTYHFSRTTHNGIFTQASKLAEIPDWRIEQNTNLEKLLP